MSAKRIPLVALVLGHISIMVAAKLGEIPPSEVIWIIFALGFVYIAACSAMILHLGRRGSL